MRKELPSRFKIAEDIKHYWKKWVWKFLSKVRKVLGHNFNLLVFLISGTFGNFLKYEFAMQILLRESLSILNIIIIITI